MVIDLLMAIFSGVAIVVSIVSLRASYIASQKNYSLTVSTNELAKIANELAKTANEMQQLQYTVLLGEIEIQIRDLIQNARNRYEDIALKHNEYKDDELYAYILESSLEGYLNAFDEACTKYLDEKVDKTRFEKLYRTEIQQLVESEATHDRFIEPQTKYRATVKVYNEWYNYEK